LVVALSLSACIPTIPRGSSVLDLARTGPRVVTLIEPAAADVYLTATVLAGSASDPVGQEGLAALTLAAITQAGAGARGPDEVRELLYEVGGALETVADMDQVTLRLRCHRDHAQTCAGLFGDLLVAPRFDEATVERLRDDAVAALTVGVADDEEHLAMLALETWLFEGRPYGHPTVGRHGALPVLGAAQVRAFWDQHYLPGATVLGVAGAADADLVGGLVARWSDRPDKPFRQEPLLRPVAFDGRELLVVDTGSDVVGFRVGQLLDVDRNHPDWPALQLAFTAFGAHRQSFGVLFGSLRAERGLNYGTYAYIEPFRERGDAALPEQGVVRRQSMLHLWLRPTSQENAPFALKLALDELSRLARDGITQAQLDDTRSYLLGSLPLQAPTPGRRLAFAVEAEATGTPDPTSLLPQALAGLTLDSVNAALYRHLRPDGLRIVAVGGDPEALIARLTGDAPTPIFYQGVSPDEAQAARDADVAAQALHLVGARVVPVGELFR
jgi:zinc protease